VLLVLAWVRQSPRRRHRDGDRRMRLTGPASEVGATGAGTPLSQTTAGGCLLHVARLQKRVEVGSLDSDAAANADRREKAAVGCRSSCLFMSSSAPISATVRSSSDSAIGGKATWRRDLEVQIGDVGPSRNDVGDNPCTADMPSPL
jgi:hypothetical protein